MTEKNEDDDYYSEYKKIEERQAVLERLRPIITFLEYNGYHRDIDYKITILENGVVDLFIGDVKAEYGDNVYYN